METINFLQLALENSGFLIVVAIFLTLFLYHMTRRIAGGVSDPFHFYYAFTFGTSYAVVALLAVKGEIGVPEIGVVVGFGLLFLIGYRSFSKISIPWMHKSISLFGGGRTFFCLAVSTYIVTSLIYVTFAGLPFLSASRFETNRGFGFLVRIMDPLRLFIVAYLAILISKRKHRARWLLGCAAVCFAIISSLLNGAKFAFLECAYVAAASIAISTGRKDLPFRKIVLPTVFVILLATGYALTQLLFNLEADHSVGGFIPGNIDRTHLVLDMFAARLVGNGDMYYLGLLPQVLHSLRIDRPLLQLFGTIVGAGVVSSLFGYDINNTDVGRQIILYWDPYYPVSGGPTDHFDMAAYVYFGPFGGIIFVLCLAFLLAQISRLKQYKYNTVGCAAVATLYCRSLPIILNPASGIALIFDAVEVFLLLSVMSKLLNLVKSTHATRLMLHSGDVE